MRARAARVPGGTEMMNVSFRREAFARRGGRYRARAPTGAVSASLRLRSAELMAVRAQRAPRPLTRRDCPSVTNEVSEASFATGRQIEQRREPGRAGRAAAFERRRTPARGFARSMIARRICVLGNVIARAGCRSN